MSNCTDIAQNAPLRIAKDSGLSRADATSTVNSVTTTVAKTPEEGRGDSDHRVWQALCAAAAARTGRNPQTGEPVKIRASKTPRFAAGATLKTAGAGPRQVTAADVPHRASLAGGALAVR